MGVRRRRINPTTTELSCAGVIKALADLISPYPLPKEVSCSYPMSENATRELRDGPTDKNQLVPDLLNLARSICGTIGFIVTHVRVDGYFAFCVCSSFMNEASLTRRAFAHLLRLAWYLVNTGDLPLTLRNIGGSPGQAVGDVKAYVDTSHGNAAGGRSWGGFIILNTKGGGALAWKCRQQPIVADSSGGQELVMASLAYKYIMAIRMLMADLNLGAAAGPTPLYTDSKIVLDGLACDKLVKSSRWLAARYAMLRYGTENHLIDPRFIDADDNVADLLTKPLTGETFLRHRRTALGIE